jgi:hypothetical protein
MNEGMPQGATRMRKDTKSRKKTSALLRDVGGEDWVQQQLVGVMLRGKGV